MPQPETKNQKPKTSKVAIIGAGLGGLTVAWHLERAGVAYDLFEADATVLGGAVQSGREGPYQLEFGPNSLQLSPELETLLTDLGLAPDIVDTAAVSQNRFILRGGRFRVLPGSPPALLASGFFSVGTKLRLLRELVRRPAPVPPDTTLAAFFGARFGSEVVDFALAPFVAGVWAGDPQQLWLHQTMPRVAALAAEYGSVIRGLAKTAGATQRRRIIGLRHGAEQLPLALAADLHHLHTGTAVQAVRKLADGTFRVELAGDGPSAETEKRTYRAVVLALPTYAAAPLLAPDWPTFAAELAAVRYPPMAVVHLAYPRAAVPHPLNGFGALHPARENTLTAGTIWTSSLFPDRCPPTEVLLTTFVGGTQFPDAPNQPDDVLRALVDAELRRLYGITAAPTFGRVFRWPRAIPQLDAALAPVRAALPVLATEGLHVAANWASGVGVPDVVAGARQIAERLRGR